MSNDSPWDPFWLWLIPIVAVLAGLIVMGIVWLAIKLFEAAWRAGGKGEE